jgi:hypothetical protein
MLYQPAAECAASQWAGVGCARGAGKLGAAELLDVSAGVSAGPKEARYEGLLCVAHAQESERLQQTWHERMVRADTIHLGGVMRHDLVLSSARSC